MKRIILIFTLILVLGIFVGCEKVEPKITISKKEVTLEVGETYELKPMVSGIADYKLVYRVDSDEVLKVEDNKVFALKKGEATVKIFLKEYEDVFVEVKVFVEEVPGITITGPIVVEVGEEIILVAELVGIEEDILWISNNKQIATVKDGVVKGVSKGVVTIIATAGDFSETIDIMVTHLVDTEEPMFVFDQGINKDFKLNWNKPFNPLVGVKAIDDFDGDITDKIEVVGTINNQNYGVQSVELVVEDRAGNISRITREIEVVWNYDVTFIGHAGSYYGLMNSEEAILYAVQVLKYQAVEIDVKQSSDGVFILSHDDTFGGYTLASTPWSVLKDVQVTQGRNAGFPSQNGSVTGSPYTTKLCTLERYLEICKEYNVKAVIELKSSPGITNSDQSRMQALMDVIEEADMLDDIIFLGSQYNCLIWTRNNGYEDVVCQYLVNSIESETFLQRCIDYNFHISTNVTSSYSNSDEWIARYKEKDIKVAVYTFTQYVDYPEVQKWIDKGVDYVTVDWQLMNKLNLPESSSEPVQTYKVTFKDYDGKILKVASVAAGKTAAAPIVDSRDGYTFDGWDKDISNVNSNFEVTAKYILTTYTITYDANNYSAVEVSWANKQAFSDDFYNDFYQWLLTNGNNIPEVTITGSTVKMVKNGVTVQFSNASGILDIDIYNFEKTLSNLIYKPVVRATDGSAVIESSEDYFLNSAAYRQKYINMDKWLVNAIKQSYTSYDDTYKPLGDGRIQIFFRMHQWFKGTNIAAFNTLPKKYDVVIDTENVYELPTTPLLYTIEDVITLPQATGTYEFKGWFLDRDCTLAISKIEIGSTGNIVVYALWEKQ